MTVLLVEETGIPGENHRPVGCRKSLTNVIINFELLENNILIVTLFTHQFS